MVMDCHDSICWADLGEARGSKPAKGHPVLVVQSGPFNASRLNTTIAAVTTSNTARATMPGNVFLPAAVSGLYRASVINVTALVTLDKSDLDEPVGYAPASPMGDVDAIQGELTATSGSFTSPGPCRPQPVVWAGGRTHPGQERPRRLGDRSGNLAVRRRLG